MIGGAPQFEQVPSELCTSLRVMLGNVNDEAFHLELSSSEVLRAIGHFEGDPIAVEKGDARVLVDDGDIVCVINQRQ